MTLAKILHWTVFIAGAAGALLSAWGTLTIAPAISRGISGEDGLAVLAVVVLLVLLGLGALAGIAIAHRMLKRDRWIAMVLVLAVSALTVPTLAVVAGKTIGPLPYDEQGLPIQ
jgi:amino acid transporter